MIYAGVEVSRKEGEASANCYTPLYFYFTSKGREEGGERDGKGGEGILPK